MTHDEIEQDAGDRVGSEMILPLIAEELEVTKRLKEAGRIRISKRVSHTPAAVDEKLRSEKYEVKHVPINQPAAGRIEPRQEGDTLILPVLEEVLVLEKRLMLIEEVHITRKVENRQERQQVDLRKEEVSVERLAAPGSEA